jgi:tetratricopeptide (TPR) repeat protein
MKRVLAGLLYVGFLALALRVHAVTLGTPLSTSARGEVSTQIALAISSLQRYRETAGGNFVTQADAAIRKALALAPEDYIAQRTAVAVMLAQHQNRAALERATALHLRFPDDVDTYAVLIDAQLALGLHNEAEIYTQRLLDLRPDNLPGLVRAARLRELYGDWQGAIDFVNATVNRVTAAELEERAGLYVHLARLHFGAGRPEIARAALAEALQALPDYPVALEETLRIERLSGATEVARKSAEHLHRVAPSAVNLLRLARATAQAGDGAAARVHFEQFVRMANTQKERDDELNLALSTYYLAEGRDPEQALALAALVREHRADPPTVLAYGLALHGAGRDTEAMAELEALLALGYHDADFLFAAGDVFASAGQARQARELLNGALASAPQDPRASAAAQRLRAITAEHGALKLSDHLPSS